MGKRVCTRRHRFAARGRPWPAAVCFGAPVFVGVPFVIAPPPMLPGGGVHLSTAAAEIALDCPVTIPSRRFLDGRRDTFEDSSFQYHGNGRLVTLLPFDGVMRARRRDVAPDGSFRLQVPLVEGR
jgi:hypothetical protein